MIEANARLSFEVRPYRDEDEPQVLALLRATLGNGPAGVRSSEFFRWKHVSNPFGRSFMLVADLDGQIIGLRAFMRWTFRAGERIHRAVRAVDTATHPDFQGKGIFSRLTLAALDELKNDVDFVFNTPNDQSLPGYLKMGWREVGRVPVWVRVRRPLRLLTVLSPLRRISHQMDATPAASATPAREILSEEWEPLPQLLEAQGAKGNRLSTARDIEYLRWRYGSTPHLTYRAITETRGNDLRGLAIFRVRPRRGLWETTVTELLVCTGDRHTARRLLRRVAGSASVDHLACHFPHGSDQASAAARSGFLPSPGGVTLAVNRLRGALEPDPTTLSSWAFSFGDLEVF
jgi:GNAT superfamily N-acetyltransferase